MVYIEFGAEWSFTHYYGLFETLYCSADCRQYEFISIISEFTLLAINFGFFKNIFSRCLKSALQMFLLNFLFYFLAIIANFWKQLSSMRF